MILNITIVERFIPEQKRVRKNRARTHEEISKLLEIGDERMRVIILLLASTAIRVGTISSLKTDNLQ